MPASRKTPGKTRKYVMTAVTAGSVLLAAAACASRAAAPAAAAPAVTGSTAVTGTACQAALHSACWQDEPGTSLDQVVEAFDHNGAPLFWINNAGGTWAGNDAFGITGYSVFDKVAYLYPYQNGKPGPCTSATGCEGVLVLDGQVLTARDIAFTACLLKPGTTLSGCRSAVSGVK